MKKRNLHKLLFLLCLLIIVGNIVYQVILYRNDIFKKFDFSYWEFRYNHSQWAMDNTDCHVTDPHINPNTCTWDDNWYQHHKTIDIKYQHISIGDDGLYMYAGGVYLKGKDPTLLNAELPPFGKYVLGAFETVTGIIGSFSVFFGVFALLLFYLFNRLLFKSSLVAIIPVTLFSFELLFTEQLRAPFLDTMYLCFLLLSFIFFLKKKYVFAAVFAGLFMSIKSPFLVILLYATLLVFLFVKKEFSLKRISMMIGTTLFVYIATYARTFMLGNSMLYFLRVQKFIVHFYQTGAKAVIGGVFPMLIMGKWYTWFGVSSSVAEWNIFWILLLAALLVTIGLLIKRKHVDGGILFQVTWLLFYFVFLIFTPIFPRYLLLAIPFLYNLVVWVFLKNTKVRSFLLS